MQSLPTIRRPSTFSDLLEWFVWLAIIIVLPTFVVHTYTANRFDELARRYDNTRWWRATELVLSFTTLH